MATGVAGKAGCVIFRGTDGCYDRRQGESGTRVITTAGRKKTPGQA